MSEKRSRSGLLSRIAAPIAKAARLVVGREAINDMSEADAEREMAAAGDLLRKTQAEPRALTEEDFTLALGQVLNEDEGKFGVKLQVISLVEFREAVGERWSKVADKVMMIAEGVINLHIGAGNIFSRQGTDLFVLLFRTCNPPEARRRALMIAQELGTRLVGDQFIGIEQPLALAAELDAETALRPDGTFDFGAIDDAVSEMRSLVSRKSADKTSRGWVPEARQYDTGLRRHMMPSAPAANPTATAPIELPPEKAARPVHDPEWKPMAPRPKDEGKAPTWVSLGNEEEKRQPPAPGVISTAPLPAEAVLALYWRPTWVAAGETIGAYKAHLHRSDVDGEPPIEGAQAYPIDDAVSANRLDRFGIAMATRAFRLSEEAGNNSTVIIPIHWRTLAAENRMDFLAPFADLTQDSRAMRVVIDLFGVPYDVGAKHLADVIRAARPLCREVVLRGRLNGPWARLAADCGASMVGIDLAELAPSERTDDDHLLEGLSRFQDSARKAGTGAYVWGARRRKAVVGAILDGFAMVNGPALMKDIVKPGKVLPAPKARVTAAPAK